MDYVRRELLRQQMTLARLLLGGGDAEETREYAERAEREANLTLSARNPADWTEERAVGMKDFPELADMGGIFLDSAADGRGTEYPGGRTEPVRGVNSGRSSLRPLRETASESWTARSLPEIPAEAAGGAANVRALSRAVQRDARRYDGGFSIY